MAEKSQALQKRVDSSGNLPNRRAIFEFLSNKTVLAILTLLPAAALFLFINLFPIGWAFAASFFEVSPFSTQWDWTALGNYAEVIADEAFWYSLWRSLVFAAGSVGFQLVVGIGIALIINKEIKFATTIRSIVMLPYLVPTAILGFIALWMGDSTAGIINNFLLEFGLIQTSISFFGSFDLAMISVILTSSWKFTIFVTIMVLARLQGIPDGYYEAAKMAGATPFQRFRHITLPNLKGVIFIVLLLRGVWMFNKFDIIFILTGGGPSDATTTSAIYMYDTAFTRLSLGRAATMSVFVFVLLAVAAVLYFWVLNPSEEVRTE